MMVVSRPSTRTTGLETSIPHWLPERGLTGRQRVSFGCGGRWCGQSPGRSVRGMAGARFSARHSLLPEEQDLVHRIAEHSRHYAKRYGREEHRDVVVNPLRVCHSSYRIVPIRGVCPVAGSWLVGQPPRVMNGGGRRTRWLLRDSVPADVGSALGWTRCAAGHIIYSRLRASSSLGERACGLSSIPQHEPPSALPLLRAVRCVIPSRAALHGSSHSLRVELVNERWAR